jgi:hypothetical protein
MTNLRQMDEIDWAAEDLTKCGHKAKYKLHSKAYNAAQESIRSKVWGQLEDIIISLSSLITIHNVLSAQIRLVRHEKSKTNK